MNIKNNKNTIFFKKCAIILKKASKYVQLLTFFLLYSCLLKSYTFVVGVFMKEFFETKKGLQFLNFLKYILIFALLYVFSIGWKILVEHTGT